MYTTHFELYKVCDVPGRLLQWVSHNWGIQLDAYWLSTKRDFVRSKESLCWGKKYEPGLTKTSFIVDPTLWYIHAVIAQSFAGRANSQGVVGKQELLYLYSRTQRKPLYLGFILAEFLSHQGQHTRLSSIITGPYITHFIQGIWLIGELEGQVIMGSKTSLRISTLRSIRMVIRPHSSS